MSLSRMGSNVGAGKFIARCISWCAVRRSIQHVLNLGDTKFQNV